jgi:hypothetical protein
MTIIRNIPQLMAHMKVLFSLKEKSTYFLLKTKRFFVEAGMKEKRK